MRAHGLLNFPDPDSLGRINIGHIRGSKTGINPGSPPFQSAEKVCQSLDPAYNVSPAQRAQLLDALLKYARCMRAHGVLNYPDPRGNGTPSNPITVDVGGGPGLDAHTPQWQSASKACRPDLASSGLPTGSGPSPQRNGQ